MEGFAGLYDSIMENADYDKWYKYIETIIKEKKIAGRDVLDLGCGTGEIAIRLKKNGYNVLGVDISDEMLAIAGEKIENMGLDIPLAIHDMRKFKLPVGFDIILSLFDTVNYLSSVNELEKTFKAVYSHFDQNGIYIFDIVTENMMEEMFPGGIFVDDREEMTLIWARHVEEDGINEISTTFFVKEKTGRYKRVDDYYTKKIFSKEEIEKTAAKIGFKSVEFRENSALAGERIFCILEK